MANEAVTRREVDMLKTAADIEHAKIWTRIESLDDHGSRGVQLLTARVDGLIRDVADLKLEVKTDVASLQVDMEKQFDNHQNVHDKDIQDRKESRKFRITAAVAAVTAVAAIIGMLIEILKSIH